MLAEGVGFEPTIRFPVYTLSKRAPSATRPPLRARRAQYSHGPRRDNPRGGWPEWQRWNCHSAASLLSSPDEATQEDVMGRGILLWLIGIPLPIILLIWLFG